MFLADAASTVVTAAPSTTVTLGPVYSFLEPYILAAFGVIFSALLAWGLALFQKYTGIVVAQNARDQVQTAVMNAAGRIVASQDDRFATMKIPVTSPLVAAEIPVVENVVKGAVDQLGLTPDHIGQLIQGKIGQLQAQAQSVAPPTSEAGK